MNIIYILVGLFFLLNPNIVLFDVLPDFIGYILILGGLSNAAKLNLTLRDSLKAFRNLLILSICRIPALLIYIYTVGDTWGLLFNLSFGVFEAYFGVCAFRDLLDGLSNLANAKEEIDISRSPVFERQKEVRLLTYLFVVAKPIIVSLPEFTVLFSDDQYGVVTSNGIESLARYHLLFTVIAFVIALILGIVWYIRIAGYFRKIRTDRAFLAQINERYMTEVFCDPVKENISRIFAALILLIVAAAFSLELKFDGYNLIPRPIFLSFILGAALYLRSIYPTLCKKAVRNTTIAIVGTAAAWIYTYAFVYSFYSIYLTDTAEGAVFSVSSVLETLLIRDFSVIYGFWGMIFASVMDGFFLVIVLLPLRNLLQIIIREHTGGTVAPDGHLLGGGSIEKNIKPTLNLLNALVIVGMISALSGVVQTALLPYLPEYWMADMVIRICFIVIFIWLICKIRDEMKDRYDLC